MFPLGVIVATLINIEASIVGYILILVFSGLFMYQHFQAAWPITAVQLDSKNHKLGLMRPTGVVWIYETEDYGVEEASGYLKIKYQRDIISLPMEQSDIEDIVRFSRQRFGILQENERD